MSDFDEASNIDENLDNNDVYGFKETDVTPLKFTSNNNAHSTPLNVSTLTVNRVADTMTRVCSALEKIVDQNSTIIAGQCRLIELLEIRRYSSAQHVENHSMTLQV